MSQLRKSSIPQPLHSVLHIAVNVLLVSQILPKVHSAPFFSGGGFTLENNTLWTCSVKDGPIVQTSIRCVTVQRPLSANLPPFCWNSNE